MSCVVPYCGFWFLYFVTTTTTIAKITITTFSKYINIMPLGIITTLYNLFECLMFFQVINLQKAVWFYLKLLVNIILERH